MAEQKFEEIIRKLKESKKKNNEINEMRNFLEAMEKFEASQNVEENNKIKLLKTNEYNYIKVIISNDLPLKKPVIKTENRDRNTFLNHLKDAIITCKKILATTSKINQTYQFHNEDELKRNMELQKKKLNDNEKEVQLNTNLMEKKLKMKQTMERDHKNQIGVLKKLNDETK